MDSEARLAARQAEADERRRLERQRKHFERQINAELETASPKVLVAANAVLESNRSRLSGEGVAELQAYIVRLPGRLKAAAVEKMIAGASIEDGLAGAVLDLARRAERKAAAMLGQRKYRAGENEPAS